MQNCEFISQEQVNILICVGAFECELLKNKKIKFTISGMNDNIRKL